MTDKKIRLFKVILGFLILMVLQFVVNYIIPSYLTILSVIVFSYLHSMNTSIHMLKKNPDFTIFWKVRKRLKIFKKVYTNKKLATKVFNSRITESGISYNYIIKKITYKFPLFMNIYCLIGSYTFKLKIDVSYITDKDSVLSTAKSTTNLVSDILGHTTKDHIKEQLSSYFSIEDPYSITINDDLPKGVGNIAAVPRSISHTVTVTYD